MRLFGLIGKTLKHSFSKDYFNNKFAELGLDDRYENFELASIDDFPALVAKHPHLHGLNITPPYKESVIHYLHMQDPVVRKTGACNCIRIRNGKLTGYNTDVIGFRESLLPILKPHHKKALVFGTGGGAKAVCYVLNELGIENRFVSRTKKRYDSLSYEQLSPDIIRQYHVLVNTTPLGMYPNVIEAPPIPYDQLGKDHLLYDLIYNPERTPFLKKGEERGAVVKNGLAMLHIQAEENWKIWNEPD
jgi:shikimate dehydrogenase